MFSHKWFACIAWLVVSYTLGNGRTVVNAYDSLGRATGAWVCNNGSTAAYCGSSQNASPQLYGFAIGIVGSQVKTDCDNTVGRCTSLAYDAFNRPMSQTTTKNTPLNLAWTYDLYGNRLSQTVTAGTGFSFTGSYNAATNQLLPPYQYDAAGNMTDDTFHTYTYDAEGNITQVDGGKTAQYSYDVFNRRIHVQTPSGTTEYTYDYAGRRISSWVSPNNVGEEGRIYWDGLQLAYRSSLDGTTYFDHQDTLGTERERTNYAGSVESSYPSGIWGDDYTDTVNSSGAGQDNARFAGLEYDAASGTEHAQFRNYSPAQGRCVS